MPENAQEQPFDPSVFWEDFSKLPVNVAMEAGLSFHHSLHELSQARFKRLSISEKVAAQLRHGSDHEFATRWFMETHASEASSLFWESVQGAISRNGLI